MTDLVAYTTDEVIEILVIGSMPNSCFVYAFGNPKNPDSFFDPTKFDSIKVKCTQGAAGGAGAIILQQLRT